MAGKVPEGGGDQVWSGFEVHKDLGAVNRAEGSLQEELVSSLDAAIRNIDEVVAGQREQIQSVGQAIAGKKKSFSLRERMGVKSTAETLHVSNLKMDKKKLEGRVKGLLQHKAALEKLRDSGAKAFLGNLLSIGQKANEELAKLSDSLSQVRTLEEPGRDMRQSISTPSSKLSKSVEEYGQTLKTLMDQAKNRNVRIKQSAEPEVDLEANVRTVAGLGAGAITRQTQKAIDETVNRLKYAVFNTASSGLEDLEVGFHTGALHAQTALRTKVEMDEVTDQARVEIAEIRSLMGPQHAKAPGEKALRDATKKLDALVKKYGKELLPTKGQLLRFKQELEAIKKETGMDKLLAIKQRITSGVAELDQIANQRDNATIHKEVQSLTTYAKNNWNRHIASAFRDAEPRFLEEQLGTLKSNLVRAIEDHIDRHRASPVMTEETFVDEDVRVGTLETAHGAETDALLGHADEVVARLKEHLSPEEMTPAAAEIQVILLEVRKRMDRTLENAKAKSLSTKGTLARFSNVKESGIARLDELEKRLKKPGS